MLKLEQLSINAIKEHLEEDSADYRSDHYQNNDRDDQSVDVIIKRDNLKFKLLVLVHHQHAH